MGYCPKFGVVYDRKLWGVGAVGGFSPMTIAVADCAGGLPFDEVSEPYAMLPSGRLLAVFSQDVCPHCGRPYD